MALFGSYSVENEEERARKRSLFLRILGIIAVLGLGLSLIAKVTFLAEDPATFPRIAVVGPMSGEHAEIGRSLRQGADLFVAETNAEGGINGVKLAVETFDDKGEAATAAEVARRISADDRVLAVVGHWSAAALREAGAVYAEAGIPLITPASTDEAVVAENPWMFATMFDQRHQARFMANYARNVLGHKLVTMVSDGSEAGNAMAADFEETYRRFGTAIRYQYAFEPQADTARQIETITAEIKERKDSGLVFLAMDGPTAARFMVALRKAGARNPVVATAAQATSAFTGAIAAVLPPDEEPARYTNGIYASVPLLLDTANETAQNVRNAYQKRFGDIPDWVAAYSYDTVSVAVAGLRDHLGGAESITDAAAARERIRTFLAGRNSPDASLQGVSGALYFSAEGVAKVPAFVGLYNGTSVISALTQLQPIRPGRTANYIDELRKGKVLYVNDRFMYKTNVVYTGIEVKEISAIDTEAGTAQLDFLMWFRYRGDFEPQQVTFANAVEPVVLDEPLEEQAVGDMTYRLYRVEGAFTLDFTETFRPYGSHVVGVRFNHDKLNRNNLLYVVDVLGLGLEAGGSVGENLRQSRALNPTLDWGIDRAWISQDVAEKGTRGDPAYVGFGATEPDFSRIDLGVLIAPAEIDARDFVPSEYFVYIGIFGLLGVLFAIGMDRRERGRFWSAQSWGLRVVSWPLFLVAAQNIGLDLAVQTLSPQYVDLLVMAFDILWWVVPARLLALAMERFVWRPLEDHTERNIPNVIRVFASISIYSFALFGVIAFVFDQQLTSLLASTGLLAMIIGLAIQANISNIFSGIVLNLERPFNVGDWVQIGDMDEGRVVDITWRTTRVKTRNGYVISLPNGQVSEALVHNFNSFESVRIELPVVLDADIPIEHACEVMEEGLEKAEEVDPTRNEARFKRVDWNFGWISVYEIQFWITDYGRREEIAEGVLFHVYAALRAHGIGPSTVQKAVDTEIAPKGNPAAPPPQPKLA